MRLLDFDRQQKILSFEVPNVSGKFCQNGKKCDRESPDTKANRWSYNLSHVCNIAMGQIIIAQALDYNSIERSIPRPISLHDWSTTLRKTLLSSLKFAT